ncbi:helix-turn-helix domain-containing protein [Leuconostoc citreum]
MRKETNIIKERRKLKNLSQKQLGAFIGSQAMVSRIESGQILPNAQSIYFICKELDITIDEYFSNHFEIDFNIVNFRNKLNYKYLHNDIDGLYAMYNELKLRKILTLNNKHDILMLKATIYHTKFRIASTTYQNVLIDYFNKLISWQLYDIYLLECTVNMLPVTLVRPYISDILGQYIYETVQYNQLDNITNLIIRFFETSLLQNKPIIIEWIIKKIEDIPLEDSLTHQVWLLFLIGLYRNEQHKIDQAYTILTILDDCHLKNIFKRIALQYAQMRE